MSNEYTPSQSVQDQINDMVAAASARVEHGQRLTSTDGTQHGSIKVEHDGSVTMLGEPRPADRLPDDHRNLDVERSNNQRRIDDLQTQLDAHTFDPRTGQKILVVQGQCREAIEMELMSARNAAALAEHRYQQLEQQRARDTAWKQAEDAERLTYLQVTGGDPAKMARLQELLGDEELKTAAQAILAARLERSRQ